MTTREDLIQLQQLSGGIKPDLDADGWHVCYYSETAGNARNEEYYFPCSNDKECCGRECCTPVPGGFPLWLLILLVVLGFLLLLVIILCIVYYCWKYCCRRKKAPTPPLKQTPVIVQKSHPPPPKVEMYKRVPLISGGTLRRIPSDNLIEIKSTSPNSRTGTTTYTATTPVSFNSSSTTHSHHPYSTSSYYGSGRPGHGGDALGYSSSTRPKNFTTINIVDSGPGRSGSGIHISSSTSPKHRNRRGFISTRHQLASTGTATDSSPGGDDIIVGGQRVSDPTLDRDLVTTTPTSNTASEREPPFVPSPMEETFESAPKPIRIEHHDEREITQEKRPFMSHVDTPREQKPRMDYIRSDRT